MNASLVYHGGTAILQFPYDQLLVERLKSAIPAYARAWVPALKQWHVERPYDSVAARLLREHFPAAWIEAGPAPTFHSPGATGCACDADHRRLFVCQGAPKAVIDAAYRALAREHHPDLGGDTRAMQQINESYERIRDGVRP